MTSQRRIGIKFAVFVIVMSMLTASLGLIFGHYRGGSTNDYTALFANASQLKAGQSVRVAGVVVGTVNSVTLKADKTVDVDFDADRKIVLTTGTRAVVRYLNLVGDRYLELVDGPGSPRVLPPGSRIPLDRTQPALNLDLLLGGLKPLIRGLDPRDVNTLTTGLVQVLQGQGGAIQALLTNTSSFTNTLADHGRVLQDVIGNLQALTKTLAANSDQFAGAIDRLEKLISGLAADRDPIGSAIDSLDRGTASLADLLSDARQPLAGAVNQVARLAPLLDQDKERLDIALQKAPLNYKKLVRLGAYGSFINYYLCGLSWRVSDLQGRTAVFPWIKQDIGRCSEP
ncbi:MCE family protein [Mycolicibacterium sp.]|uniref:MCE family protein n=1 Tax=Mycolicibacterium sp. TaxID=2320850 RepID=UPI0037C8637E